MKSSEDVYAFVFLVYIKEAVNTGINAVEVTELLAANVAQKLVHTKTA